MTCDAAPPSTVTRGAGPYPPPVVVPRNVYVQWPTGRKDTVAVHWAGRCSDGRGRWVADVTLPRTRRGVTPPTIHGDYDHTTAHLELALHPHPEPSPSPPLLWWHRFGHASPMITVWVYAALSVGHLMPAPVDPWLRITVHIISHTGLALGLLGFLARRAHDHAPCEDCRHRAYRADGAQEARRHHRALHYRHRAGDVASVAVYTTAVTFAGAAGDQWWSHLAIAAVVACLAAHSYAEVVHQRFQPWCRDDECLRGRRLV
jgi:hypothetical protein